MNYHPYALNLSGSEIKNKYATNPLSNSLMKSAFIAKYSNNENPLKEDILLPLQVEAYLNVIIEKYNLNIIYKYIFPPIV